MSQNYIITNGELYHYGVKGMKWGKRKARVWTRAPEGYSIGHQLKEIRLKNEYKNEKDRDKKKQLKREYKELVALGHKKSKEWAQFEKDMHAKVGRTSRIKATENPDGTYTYTNKKGQTFKKFEVDGAVEYEQTQRSRRGKFICDAICASAFGGLVITTLNGVKR